MKRLEELSQLIKMYDKAYEEGNPIITDTEYDLLYKELVELEQKYGVKNDSPTQYIEDAKIAHLTKVKHLTPMLSQEKAHTEEDIKNFLNRTNDDLYIVDLKLDGVSIALKYQNGKLTQAVTRGNSQEGYDITAAAINMAGVPLNISQEIDIEVRGEVLISDKDFEKLNSNGDFKNSRNLVAGTLNCLDVDLVKERKLYVNIYDIRSYKNSNSQCMSTLAAHKLLNDLGFNVVKYWIFKKEEEKDLINFCKTFNNTIRPTLGFKIDGLVLKSNNEEIIKKLGNTNKFPKSSIAFKFDSQDRTTILRKVEWQVGRTGQITPVGIFDEIEIDGVNITKASLANINNIKNRDIKINDTVVVARSNDVIPQITSVVKELRKDTIDIVAPEECPVCGKKTIFKNDILYCLNENCSAKILYKLVHFCERDSMNILDLSEKTINKFLEAGVPLNNFTDIYNLHKYKDKIIELEGFKPQKIKGQVITKRIDNILNQIEQSKNNSFSNLLTAFGINNIGSSSAKILAKKYISLENLFNLICNNNMFDEISSIKDIGPVQAKSLIDFFNSNFSMINEFINMGKFEEEINNTSNKLLNKTFIITGTLSQSRDYFKELIENNSGKVSGSVSSKTDFVLLGDEPNISSKHQKAIELNIKIINESEFLELLK